MPKLLLIGGYPKGFAEPFHPATKSGRILRDILRRNNIEAEFLDLWNNENEEKKSEIRSNKIVEILEFKENGFEIIALGKHVHNCISRQSNIPIRYLPHPASRKTKDRRKLEAGLLRFFNYPM